jgi:Protein of unknown function DUF115
MRALEAMSNTPAARPVGLPDGFDVAEDAVLLIGKSGDERLRQLLSLGVERIVSLGTEPNVPLRGVRAARSTEEAVALFLEYEKPPRNVVVERIPGGGYSLEEAQAIARQVATSTANRATFAATGTAWVKHAISSLSSLSAARPVSDLVGQGRGRAGVLVSPGPSLDRNVRVLAEYRDRFVVVAGNRALRPLRDAGVVPDVVLVSDPLNVRYQLDSGLLDGVQALVLDVVAHPEVWALSTAPKYFFNTVREVSQLGICTFDGDNTLRGGGSVATVALSFAVLLDLNPIVLVGQDLALKGSQYYARAAPDGETRISLEGSTGRFENSGLALREAMRELGTAPENGGNSVQTFLEVPGYSGGTVMTSKQFDTYRRWFGEEALRLGRERKVINATEGGAHIDNMDREELRVVAARLQESASPLELPPLNAPSDERRTKKRLLAHVETLQARLREAATSAQDCLKLSRQAKSNHKVLARLQQAEQRLGAATSELPFLVALSSAQIEVARRKGANARTLDESLDAASCLFQAILEAIQFTQPLLGAAKRSLQA